MMKKGFTLIELMVVIAIIGLLAAIALPRFAGVTDQAKVANVQGNLNTLRTSIEMYNASNTEYPDLVTQAANGEDLQNVIPTNGDQPFTDFFAKSTLPDTPADGANAEAHDVETGTVNSTNPNSITGTGNGGWVYDLPSGQIRADLADGAYGDDDIDWSEF